MANPISVRFQKPFLSIKEFPDITLPSLTVLTGVNGVGKTHFLRGLKGGNLVVEGIGPKEILYFDWTSMYTLKSSTVHRKDVRPSRKWLRDGVKRLRRVYERDLATCLNELGCEHGDSTWRYIREHPRLLTEPQVSSIVSKAQNELGELAPDINQTVQQFLWLEVWEHQHVLPALLLDEHELELLPSTHSLGEKGLEIRDIGAVMMSYFELQTHNRLCVLDEAEGRPPQMTPLSESEFVARNGPPPWELMTEVMNKLGLDFEIHGPQSYSCPDFTPLVIKRSTGETIGLQHLSSGEKMLMALSVSTYASRTQGMREANPIKLVLLDEIDAPLHPSMSRTMLEIVQETLVERLGCSVILATHSPTTVAVAPEGSIHVMRADTPGIEQVSRERAVRLLTSELPTLSLDFSGRRQVFVESQNDAGHYEAIYQLYKIHLDSPFSLSFIGVGVQSDKGDKGSGCDAVVKLVRELRVNGNPTVWGLVDWDGKNKQRDYVQVLAHGRRYAIENCLLDPLHVLALVIDASSKADLGKLGLEPTDGISSLMQPEAAARRQELVDRVQALVLGDDLAQDPAAPAFDSTEVTYHGGFTHQVRLDYLRHQGHGLVDRIKGAFDCLRRHRSEKALLDRTIHLLKENPSLLPVEVLETLKALSAED